MEASVLIMHLASPAARLLCILGQTAREHASSKRQSLGRCPRRFWQEPQDAEPHGLPVPTGVQHISPGLPCASPGHWSPFHSCISSQSHNTQCVRRLASMWMSLPSQAANPSMQWLTTSASLCMPFLSRETLLPLFSAACLTHLLANVWGRAKCHGTLVGASLYKQIDLHGGTWILPSACMKQLL